MKKSFKRIGIPALLLFGMLIGGYTPQAYAVPTLSFSVDGGAAVSCADGDGCDMDPQAGVVVYIASLGGVYGVNVSTGITKPLLGGSQMDLNSINIQSLADGAHTLSIMFSETGYSLLDVTGIGAFGGTISDNGSTVVASAYFDDATNALFNMGTLIGTTGPLSGPAFSTTFTGRGPAAASYSMTQLLTVSTTERRAMFSGDFELTMVPEPASIALLGGTLLFVTGVMRKKLRRS
jgi:hypothetical protein